MKSEIRFIPQRRREIGLLGMDGDGKDKVAFILVAVCESVLPNLLYLASRDPSV